VAQSLGVLLDDARERSFVGRSRELASFDAALAGTAPHRVLFVHGAGGVGKTTLLEQLRVRAERAGRRVVQVDGHAENLGQDALEAAVRPADEGAGPVLLVDGYEALGGLDRWMREELLPSLPADAVTVLAGRDAPGTAWRSDPGWRWLLAEHHLDVLDATEASELLRRAGVAHELHPRLVDLGGGNPLALALLADAAVRGVVPDDLRSAPDVVAALLPVLVGVAPDADHETGLHACVHTWLLTRDLLEEAVGDRAAQVWEWLASRPFVVRSPAGLYPHELTRQVLEAELDRRSPDARRFMHRLVNRVASRRLQQAGGAERLHQAMQLLWLHRNGPLGTGVWALRDREGVAVVPGRQANHAAVAAIVEARESPDAARVAEAWLDVQPDSLVVIRQDGEVVAFAIEPVLPAAPALEHDDPVVRAVREEMARLAPIRPGERWSIGRCFGDRADYQRGALGVLTGSTSSCANWMTRALAWSWVATVDPEFWEPPFAYLAFHHRLEVEAWGRTYVAFGIDWRRTGTGPWLDVMSERELTGDVGPMPAHLLRPPPLDRATFDSAVRDALRCLSRPADLARSPLMGSELATTARGPDVERLQRRLGAAVDVLTLDKDGGELVRVLDRTFVHAAPSQEAAAEVLDLPFSTYRRRLAKALERLTDLLWAVEIGELDLEHHA
jgi:hypothetical protein